jgi:hypothetical protein
MTDSAEPSFEEILKTSTAPESVPFNLFGFPDEETASTLANTTASLVKYVGTRLNLRDLDGITIAFDYPKALQELDRGFVPSSVSTPTTEFGQGVAMAPVVRRDNVIKTHIVLDANVFQHLRDLEGESFSMIFYQLAHECGHVHDHSAFDAVLPGILLTPPDFKNAMEQYQVQMAYGCCSEYAASRLSAGFWPEQVANFEEVFFTVLEGIEQRTEALVNAFDADNDGIKLFNQLSKEYERLMRFASYLLGHLNGLDSDAARAPRFKAFMESGHWLVEYITELDSCFDKLWENYAKWKDIGEFCEVGLVVQLLVCRHRVHPNLNNDGSMSIAVWPR